MFVTIPPTGHVQPWTWPKRYGTLKLSDGSIQEGTWSDGKLHGCAVFTWPHGVCEYREYDEKQGVVSVITLTFFWGWVGGEWGLRENELIFDQTKQENQRSKFV